MNKIMQCLTEEERHLPREGLLNGRGPSDFQLNVPERSREVR